MADDGGEHRQFLAANSTIALTPDRKNSKIPLIDDKKMDTLEKRIALHFRKLKENKLLPMRFHKFEALFLGGAGPWPSVFPTCHGSGCGGIVDILRTRLWIVWLRL